MADATNDEAGPPGATPSVPYPGVAPTSVPTPLAGSIPVERTDHVVVVTGAAPLSPNAVASIPTRAVIIAADGGLDHALHAGLRPGWVVGDLDSVSDAGLAWAETNANVVRFPPDKDSTDTELALDAAADLNPDRLTMLSGGGDRFDHTVAAIGALGRLDLTSIPTIDGWWGTQRFRVQHGPGACRLDELEPGAYLSLLATHGECRGVDISGVRWPLEDFTLGPLSGRGISNEVVGGPVSISVLSGVLTIFFDGRLLT